MRSRCLLPAEVLSNSVGHGVILNLLGNLDMVLSQAAVANGELQGLAVNAVLISDISRCQVFVPDTVVPS